MLTLETNLSYDGQWYDYKGARLKIRPYPASQGEIKFRDGAALLTGQERLGIFLYCLEDWENVVDADGKPLPCTEEIKKKVFDFQLGGIPLFVLGRNSRFQFEKGEQEKNLPR